MHLRQECYKMNKIFSVNFFVVCLICYANMLTGMESNPLDLGQSAAVSVQAYPEEIKNLPALVQHDAIEFYEKMQNPLLQWATMDKNPVIRSWSVFFIYSIFKKEMKVRITANEHIKIDDAIHALFSQKRGKESESSKKISSLVSILTDKNIPTNFSNVGASVFHSVLNKNNSFKKIKANNVYVQFVSGFLQLIEGIQTPNDSQIIEGQFQLTMSAFGLCNLPLEILKKVGNKPTKALCNKIVKQSKILKSRIDSAFVGSIIENNMFFDYDTSLLFTRLTKEQQNHWYVVTNNRFENFITVVHGTLDKNQQDIYGGISDFLRSRLIAKRDAASLFSTISWKLNAIVPFLTSVAGGIITFVSLDYESDQKNAMIVGGSVSLIGPTFNLLYGVVQWYNAVQVPTYSEKQMQLIALYYAANCTLSHATADSIAQPIIDYLDESYDDAKTLSQNALYYQKGIRK